eukprot:Rhum_TRINITY_DN14698_c15_g10::Rhum_TRINITY_DN14698_c15_g10_i1::g.110168::m.110168
MMKQQHPPPPHARRPRSAARATSAHLPLALLLLLVAAPASVGAATAAGRGPYGERSEAARGTQTGADLGRRALRAVARGGAGRPARKVQGADILTAFREGLDGGYYGAPHDAWEEVVDETTLVAPLFSENVALDLGVSVVAFLATVSAAGAGIGGGALLVPMFLLVLGWHVSNAVPLSNATIFGNAIANIIINFPLRHPTADRPLVDFDLALVLIPMELTGSLVGVLLNILFPQWLTLLCLLLLLVFTTYRTFHKGRAAYDKENKERRRADRDAAADSADPGDVKRVTVVCASAAAAGPDAADASDATGGKSDDNGSVVAMGGRVTEPVREDEEMTRGEGGGGGSAAASGLRLSLSIVNGEDAESVSAAVFSAFNLRQGRAEGGGGGYRAVFHDEEGDRLPALTYRDVDDGATYTVAFVEDRCGAAGDDDPTSRRGAVIDYGFRAVFARGGPTEAERGRLIVLGPDEARRRHLGRGQPPSTWSTEHVVSWVQSVTDEGDALCHAVEEAGTAGPQLAAALADAAAAHKLFEGLGVRGAADRDVLL